VGSALRRQLVAPLCAPRCTVGGRCNTHLLGAACDSPACLAHVARVAYSGDITWCLRGRRGCSRGRGLAHARLQDEPVSVGATPSHHRGGPCWSRYTGVVGRGVYRSYFSAMGGAGFWVVLSLLSVVMEAAVIGTHVCRRVRVCVSGGGYDGQVCPLLRPVTLNPPRLRWPACLPPAGSFVPHNAATRDNPRFVAAGNLLWVTDWATPEHARSHMRMWVYVGLTLGSSVLALLRNGALMFGSYRASRWLHGTMLDRVLKSPLGWFNTTPQGQILNRWPWTPAPVCCACRCRHCCCF
jgi:hypothetical protein